MLRLAATTQTEYQQWGDTGTVIGMKEEKIFQNVQPYTVCIYVTHDSSRNHSENEPGHHQMTSIRT